MSAKAVLSKKQAIIFIVLIALFVIFLFVDFRIAVISALAILTFFYFANILISFYLSYTSLFRAKEIQIDNFEFNESTKKKKWPKYTILCPLYKEANVLREFTNSMMELDYPKEKIECLLLLEEDDKSTLEAAKELKLPDMFKIVIIPDSYPKTKPKACNFGLSQATGELIVIYDAEDRPDKDQLKKAVLSFGKVSRNVGCVQAKLNYYNPRQNILTRLFTSEYTFWFDFVLPGFQAIDAPIPLGGTSNHFLAPVLHELGGWDPYNVTEDCDLGLRLKEAGYRTVVLDSTTWEEANSALPNWVRQRSRWIKGYFQTFLVHSRTPFMIIRKIGFFNFFLFMMITGFLSFASLINPFLWLTTILYFVFRPTLGSIIEQFYPSFVLYPAVFCLVIGNFLYIYNYLIGTAKKNFAGFTKYGLLMPFYWVLISFAGWYGLIQLATKPHFWEKTKHGLLKQGIS